MGAAAFSLVRELSPWWTTLRGLFDVSGKDFSRVGDAFCNKIEAGRAA
jgi:hypothetical protein